MIVDTPPKTRRESMAMDNDMQKRFNELRDKEQSGMLDDAGRIELQQIRDSMQADM